MEVRRAFACVACFAAFVFPTSCQAPPPLAPIAREAPAFGTRPWLFVSDLHFDPFANIALVDRLAASPPEHWQAIFDTDRAQQSPGASSDTNAALLRSSIAAMRVADPDPPVVVIAGDFLAHHWSKLYGHARKHTKRNGRYDPVAYAAFMDATIAYIASAFDRAFPHARFLVTLGNNDGYCGDYESTPYSPFLSHMARAFEPLVDRDRDVPDFLRSFPRYGAYVARLPLAGDRRALVTNSVIWSNDYGNQCRTNDGSAQAGERDWMNRAGASGGPSTRWWLVTHIPPGIDVVSSIENFEPTTMYSPGAARDLEALRLSGGHAFSLIVTGHTHGNAFRIAPGAGGPGTAPVLIVPAVTPVNGNDPAFAVADVTPEGIVANEVVYAARQPVFGGALEWHRSYDFDSAFGAREFDVPAIRNARATLESNATVRGRYYGQWFGSGGFSGALEMNWWRREWCAIDVGAVSSYDRCLAQGMR